MSHLSRVEEVEQQFDHLAQAGAYAEALELVTREAYIFPDYAQKVVFSWRITMACRLKDNALALQLLGEAVQAGYWYGGLRTNPDYQFLLGMPEFERLVEICSARRAQAKAEAVPVMKKILPETGSPPYPLLLALHGGGSGIEPFAGHWSAATANGWLVAVPQSSQVYAPNVYTWNDWEWALQEVQERFTALCAEFPVDPGQVVLAGFSQGGGLAAWLALGGFIKARGLILVGPFLQNADNIVPLIEAHPPQGLRAYLVAGQRDQYCLGIARRLSTLFPQFGVTCTLDIYPDQEHSFPTDFELKIPLALGYVSGF